ncbi:hypothetical protein NBE98_10955 [Clostridium swellfunianum]|uniref:hypothetical protein n=1 Tax=Clostridium swellfunianum TaxID=1367462 RepID=UPI00203034E6|nr:hypothetical protein [Clostridium swellfunianum]MCM0648892.1 hypothetical protein [Clostridium swellfunianum]
MKKHFIKSMLLLYLLSTFVLIGCSNTPSGSSYPNALIWSNISYGVSSTEVSKDELGKQLGEIKRKKEPMPTENGDANDTQVGSKLFEIKGINTEEAIAVEKSGKFYKAYKL